MPRGPRRRRVARRRPPTRSWRGRRIPASSRSAWPTPRAELRAAGHPLPHLDSAACPTRRWRKAVQHSPMDATFDRRELFEWLAAYEAAMELMAISVLAGSRRVASCPALGDFHDEYRRVVPAGRAPVAQLATAHRALVLALRDLRDGRRDGESLAQAVDR